MLYSLNPAPGLSTPFPLVEILLLVAMRDLAFLRVAVAGAAGVSSIAGASLAAPAVFFSAAGAVDASSAAPAVCSPIVDAHRGVDW